MSWDDVEDIIFDGTAEQIKIIKCPECNGSLRLSYFPLTKNVEVRCKKCGTVVKSHGVEKAPNFAISEA